MQISGVSAAVSCHVTGVLELSVWETSNKNSSAFWLGVSSNTVMPCSPDLTYRPL
ncbi:hypothetical protein [Ruminococcus sp.]|uniref:hypothetical protein n=1 Tax=Ruminococcus sp. TaxID=41978 RepID=UPI00399BF212